MLTPAQAELIYTQQISHLAREIDNHENPSYAKFPENHAYAGDYITGIAPFARAYGIDRSNLNKILMGHRELSVGLFQRIAVALGDMQPHQICTAAILQNLSLKTFLMIDGHAINSAMQLVASR